MSDLQAFHVGLNDVYDFAYNIAREFEKVVIFCDIDILKPVIDKVINVLEILESSIQRIELLETEIRNLKSNNLYLYGEKSISDQEKCKLKQIYEESEESWLEEVMNLKSQLSILKSENYLLKSHLAEKKDSCSISDDQFDKAFQEQSEFITKLKQTVNQKEKQLQDNLSTISAMNSKIQELLNLNKDLHLKNQEARNDISKLIVEKNDFKNELMLHKKENSLLNEAIEELLNSNACILKNNDECLPISKSTEYTFEEALTEDLKCYEYQELSTDEKIKKLQLELQNLRAKIKEHEENASKLTTTKNKVSCSKIHQLFHLFLGVTA